MDVVTLVIALLGFAIALISCVWQIATWFWSTARPHATMVHGIIVESEGGLAITRAVGKNGEPYPIQQLRQQGYDGPEVIGIEVVNHGRALMTVRKFELKHESGASFVPTGQVTGPPFPHRIEPGASETWYVSADMIREVSAAASIASQTGRAVSIEATLATSKIVKSRQSMQV